MNAPERGLVTDPACRIALTTLSHMVFRGGDGVVDDEFLSRFHDAHADANIVAPKSLTKDDGDWVQYECGCDVRLVHPV